MARLAGVSTATVSRALEKPEAVAEETKRRVMDAVAACGYAPNISARNLRKQETRLVTILIPDVTNPFFNEIVRGIEQVARENNYSVLLADTENLPGQETAYGSLLAARRTDGMILLNGRVPAGLLPQGHAQGKIPPIVVACEYVTNVDLPTVQIDNIDAARKATEHLIQLRHKRIGFITGPLWNVLSRDRLHGYRDALLDAGLLFEDRLVAQGNFSIASGVRAATQLLDLPQRPTAIFASNDEMAIGAIRAARDHGLGVPQDLSIMGFDDIRFAAFVDPPLTTVSQPGGEIGRTAMTLLLRIMAGQPVENRRILLPTHLEPRASTAKAG
ncbi:MAG TPA: LacI family DNA-binding transcriptional regulator [Alphaproteobacteria bacterium]|nr:LacI family DNA-binding transcriptional regulator [Alphaproteobacteria bacterium]